MGIRRRNIHELVSMFHGYLPSNIQAFMDIHLDIQVFLWIFIWISKYFHGYPCMDLLWIFDPGRMQILKFRRHAE